jgi:hypothetical protein
LEVKKQDLEVWVTEEIEDLVVMILAEIEEMIEVETLIEIGEVVLEQEVVEEDDS